MEKILAFFMSVVLLLCGAVRGSTQEKAESFRVVSYLVCFDEASLDAITRARTDLAAAQTES